MGSPLPLNAWCARWGAPQALATLWRMSILIWAMVGIAVWHFAVLVPDRFWGGIIGAFLAALLGAFASGFALPTPGVPLDNPPGISEALWPLPGSVLGLIASYLYGARNEGTAAGPQ
jgi:hypothetical protein